MRLIQVILCGGAGTRLWPMSREAEPKQFLPLAGGTRSLLQDTALRLRRLPPMLERLADGRGAVVDPTPILVTQEDTRFLAASQLAAVGVSTEQIVLEPVGRNTAPALTLAALQAQAALPGEDPVLLAMPADHVIADEQAFVAAVAGALSAALEGAVVTFGIKPSRPETGYGYIRAAAGDAEPTEGGPVVIEAFIEKPDAATASSFVEDGRHLWNSGLFMMRASVWLRALGHYREDILNACTLAMRSARRDLDFVRPLADAFRACPAESIDYAVMEHLPADRGLGIPARVMAVDAGWNDVGAWDALHDVLPKDADGNAVVGDVLLHESRNSLVFASHRTVAALGVQRLGIIETADAVLVVDLECTQSLKQVVQRLKAGGGSLAFTHRKVHRPWGWYDSLDAGPGFQVKRIVVTAGASLSLQLHHRRAEHWVVVRGTAEVTNGEQVFVLQENQSTYIPMGQKHRLKNPGDAPLEIIEVQSGDYLGEDDIVRFEDTFGRAG